MGEIRHQHIQAPLAAAISPLAISPSTLMNEMNEMRSPQHRELYALLFPTSVWVLLRPIGLCEQ